MAKEKLGSDFKPARQLMRLYFVYWFVIFLFLFIIPEALVVTLAPMEVIVPVTIFFFLPLLVIFLFIVWWIPKFWGSIIYRMTGSEITWRRGVWFRNTGIVPYNRITNVDIIQGPISRKFSIASLKIQTAGYSGANTRSSEIRLEGIKDFEGLREQIMSIVRGRKPVAVEAFEDGKDPVLSELRKIRKLLEKKRK